MLTVGINWRIANSFFGYFHSGFQLAYEIESPSVLQSHGSQIDSIPLVGTLSPILEVTCDGTFLHFILDVPDIDVSLFLWVYPDVDLDRSSSCSFFYLVRGSVKHIMGSYSHYGLAFLFGRRAVGGKGARAERRLVCSGSHRLAKAKNGT